MVWKFRTDLAFIMVVVFVSYFYIKYLHICGCDSVLSYKPINGTRIHIECSASSASSIEKGDLS